MECDASTNGAGTILLQQGQQLAYFNKGFSFPSRTKSTYDRQLLAFVLALQKWRNYLLGRHFLVKIDYCILKYLLNQQVSTVKQQHLLMKLIPFDSLL